MFNKNNKKFNKSLLIILIAMIILVNFKVILRSFFPLDYKESILKYSELYMVDPNLVAAVINTESKFDEGAVSGKGALGLMQIMPETGLWLGELIGIENIDEKLIKQPDININLGTWYLNKLSDDFNGDFDLMLAAYNGGPGNVSRWLGNDEYSDDGMKLRVIPFEETKKYVKRVKLNYFFYQYLYDLKIGEK